MRPLRRKVLRFDLADEASALRHEQGWKNAGHSAKTLVKHPDLRIVLIAMKAGTGMKTHQTAGSVSIHVLAGEVSIQVGQHQIDLSAGHLLALDRTLPHDVKALEDSTCVLSIAADPIK